jgi:hypothetical protein
MSHIIVYDPIVTLGEISERKLLVLTGSGQARISPRIAEFVTAGFQAQELKRLTGKDNGIYENHNQNQPRT